MTNRSDPPASRADLARQALRERRLQRLGSGKHVHTIPRRSMAEPAPLSHAQRRLWFLQQWEPDSSSYNLPFALRLEGPLDPSLLERALSEIVRRHAVLRSCVHELDGEPVQIELDQLRPALQVIDLEGLDPGERDALLHTLASQIASRSFVLSHGPLIRTALLRRETDRHALVIVLHHIVGDGESVSVLLRELEVLYRASLSGEPSPLSELPIQYADFAAWHRARLHGEQLERQLAYWLRHLEGSLPSLQLPTDEPRPARFGYRGHHASFELPSSLFQALSDLGRRLRATPSTILLASFFALLHRHGGQEDVVVGVPAANRDRVEIERAIGLFLNTLPIRADLSGTPSFRKLVEQIRTHMLAALASQDVPFERIVEELRPERDPSRTPIFQAMFSFQDKSPTDPELLGLQVSELEIETGTVKCDLNLFVVSGPDSLRGSLEYSTELFDHDTIVNMLGAWQRLLEAVVADPDMPISELSLLSPGQHDRLLSTPARVDPNEPLLHEGFRIQARRTPDAIAVSCGSLHVSYRALDRCSDRLAANLHALGIGPDAIVGLWGAHSVEFVVGVLGILKAGGAWLPLDPDYPPARLELMLRGSGTRLVVGSSDTKLPEGIRLIAADTVAPCGPPPAPVLDDANLAYVVYTSGSTGQPKGVGITHGAIRSLIGWQHRATKAPGTVLQFASPSFDVSVQEMFSTWRSGSKLVLVDEPIRRDPDELWALIGDEGVERLFAPFTALHQLAVAARGRPHGLREVITAGEQLEVTGPIRELLERWGAVLENQYGPSETHVATAHRLAPGTRWSTFPPIGRPIASARVYVLDSYGQLQAPGIGGELFLAGPCVARGYLHQPGLTAERFVPDPFAGEPGSRAYRTGDRARLRADGTLQFLGRLDQQIKIRGFRVEPAEIEAVLRSHPSVADAGVVVIDRGGGPELIASVVRFGDAEPANAASLRAFLADHLPGFMIPSGYAFPGALPRTPSGKLDRLTLARAPGLLERARATHTAPTRPTEAILASIWASLLDVDTVGVHDDFFALGGHSLLAIAVLARIREVMGVELLLSVLFEAPTIARLAPIVDRRLASTSPTDGPPLGIRDDRSKLSFAQQRLWFLSQLEPGSSDYNLPLAIWLCGPLDITALEEGMLSILCRHRILCSRIGSMSGHPVLLSDEAPEEILRIVDLSALPPKQRETERSALWAREVHRPFDLKRGPLVRAYLIRCGDQDHLLIINQHHVVSDGWSVRIFQEELSALYTQITGGAAHRLPELPVQYADFAGWQRERLQGQHIEELLGYWVRQLKDAPPLQLPTDTPRQELGHRRSGSHCLTIPVRAIRKLARLGEATPFMVLLAALSILLGRHARQEEVVIGCPISGRDHPGLEPLIGLFVDTLALRTQPGRSTTFRQLLDQVRQTVLGAFAHRSLPLERLVKELRPDRDLTRTPVFQAMLNLVQDDGCALRLPGIEASALQLPELPSKFDLTLYALERSEELELSLVFDADLFDSERMCDLLAQLVLVLEAAAEDQDRPLESLSLLTERARALLPDPTQRLNTTPSDERPPWARLPEHALRSPQRIAIVDHEGSWSYARLEQESQEVARGLAAAPVGAGAVVAVHAPRGAWLVALLTGVLRVGAAFVVLDPSEPLSYRARRLGISGAVLVCTAPGGVGEAAGLGLPVLDPWANARALPHPDAWGSLDAIAYVAFTSGSSGRPRAITGTGRPLVHFLSWMIRTLALEHPIRSSLLSGLGHDPLLRDVFVPLWLGGTLFIPDRSELRSPSRLAHWIAKFDLELIHLTPAVARLLCEGLDIEKIVLPKLRWILSGGDVLTTSLARALQARAPNAAIINFYGTTETPQAMSWHRLDAANGPEPATVPIGRGIDDVQLLVLDDTKNRVGIGEIGEIWVRTPYLSLGYLDDPDETANRFLTDPEQEGVRLYRTGDLGRCLPDGSVLFVGRRDQQLNLRGNRIEPEEIEAALLEHEAIEEAAVVVRRVPSGDEILVGLIVAQHAVSTLILRRFLKNLLPEPLIPNRFVAMEALPRTATGKLDREALANFGALDAPQTRTPSPPTTPAERLMAELWCEVLGLDHVDLHDGFFDLGGHSLQALVLIDRIEARLGVRLRPRDLFTHTLGQLAARCVPALGANDRETPT